ALVAALARESGLLLQLAVRHGAGCKAAQRSLDLVIGERGLQRVDRIVAASFHVARVPEVRVRRAQVELGSRIAESVELRDAVRRRLEPFSAGCAQRANQTVEIARRSSAVAPFESVSVLLV